MDNQDLPAGEAAATGATSLADVLSPAPAGNEPSGGAAPQVDATQAPAAAAPADPMSAQPAQTAATTPPASPSAPAAPAGEQDPATDPRSPRWFREHMQRVNRERAAERAELDRLRNQGGRPSPQHSQPQGPELPDPLEDPAGYAQALLGIANQRIQQTQLLTTLTISERFARQQHGNEEFETCKAWLSTRPDIEAWALQQPDPWGAAFTTYGRERLAEEIGEDPNAWREREREKLRAEILAEAGAATSQPAMTSAPQPHRAPPAPASTARSTQSRDPAGRFAPTPLGDLLAKR